MARDMPAGIIEGNWCMTCGGRKKLTIEEMQRTAKQYGGRCLSTTYTNSATILKWQCQKRHLWMARPNDIRRGYWCPVCARELKSEII